MISTTKKTAALMLSAFVLACSALLNVALTATPVAAQDGSGSVIEDIISKEKQTSEAAGLVTSGHETDIRILVGRIINGFLGLIGTFFVVLIIYAGFLYMTAQGNEEQIGKAKKMILNAVIGLAIVMSAYAIARFVVNVLMVSGGQQRTLFGN